MKISIIVPAYNYAKYVSCLIASISNQTYRNLEIIFVDDNSSDETHEIFYREIAASGLNFKYMKNVKNLGRSCSRNIGAQAASGDIIAFLDADDKYDIDYCDKLKQLYQNNGSVGVTYCPPRFFDNNGADLGVQRLHSGAPLSQQIFLGRIPYTSGIAVKKEVWESCLGFSDSLEEREDWDLFLTYVERGVRIELLSGFHVAVRKHDCNNSSNSDRFFCSTERVAERSLEIAKRIGTYDGQLHARLYLELARIALCRNISKKNRIHGKKYLFKAFVLLPRILYSMDYCKLLLRSFVPRRIALVVKAISFK